MKYKKMITTYFTDYPRIFSEIRRLAVVNGKTTSQVVVSLAAKGLREYRRESK